MLCGRFHWRIRTGRQAGGKRRLPVPVHPERNNRLRASVVIRECRGAVRRGRHHWQEKDFWKGYYWDGGIVYKHRLVRYKNGMLRFRFGPQFGAVQKRFFIGLEGGFEYSYVFRNGWEFALIQKNNVNFLHGDTFRNGLLLGMRIPF